MDTATMTHSPAEVAAMLVNLAVSKHRQRPLALFLKAFNAGVFVSFGGLMSLIVAGGSPTLASENPGLVKLLSGFVFPIGLVMIILQQQELLTSNMMVFPMALAKRAVPWWGLPRNWFIVFFGNLAGSLFVSLVLVRYSGVVSSEPYVSYIKAAVIARCINPSWAQVFLRGLGCNWLVCIAVWQGMTAKDVTSKVVAVWFPIWAFVACSFEHVVANMFLMPLGMSLGGGDLTVGQFIAKSLMATLLGNMTAALVVAALAVRLWLGDEHSMSLSGLECGTSCPTVSIATIEFPTRISQDEPDSSNLERGAIPHQVKAAS